MTTLRVEVVPIHLEKHPNADSLSICSVFNYPVIVKTADWESVATGAYIPVDALVPDTEQFAFLDGHFRIRAKKLRGIFSQGLLVPTPEGAAMGDDVASLLGVTKYEPPEPMIVGGEAASPPPIFVPEYTDIEHLRRYAHVFQPGEMVVVTEKIHGANGRWTVQNGILYAGSHHQWKKEDPASIWWKVVDPQFRDFMDQLPPDVIVFGEVFGSVQDLKYGFAPGRVGWRLFDVYDPHRGSYLDTEELASIAVSGVQKGIGIVPILASIPFDLTSIEMLAEQDSVLGGKDHVMEGVVVRPWRERFDPEIGRVILKLHSQRYLLRKGG